MTKQQRETQLFSCCFVIHLNRITVAEPNNHIKATTYPPPITSRGGGGTWPGFLLLARGISLHLSREWTLKIKKEATGGFWMFDGPPLDIRWIQYGFQLHRNSLFFSSISSLLKAKCGITATCWAEHCSLDATILLHLCRSSCISRAIFQWSDFDCLHQNHDI